MKTLHDTPVRGARVVVRIDCDVPVSARGTIEGDLRLRAAIPTIEYLRDNGAARIVLVGHLGRPVSRPRQAPSQVAAGNARLSLEPVAHHLRTLLGFPHTELELEPRRLEGMSLPAYPLGQSIFLLENLRFDPRETQDDRTLARELAGLGDLYVFDAFAVAHRTHASTVGAIQEAKVAVAGIQFERELAMLGQATKAAGKPFVCVLGGAKVETKLPIIEHLLDTVDSFLLGGVMANTFAGALGTEIGRSVADAERMVLAKTLYDRAPDKFVLPEDYVWQGDKILDIGAKTRDTFTEVLKGAKTIFWNGTMGMTSTTARDFRIGTVAVARAIADNEAAHSVVSGGDTVALLTEEELSLDRYRFVSMGGGSTLAFMAGETLPAVAALNSH
ncbi:MAG: phosphoglycerate kinase [Patescibacteria group bacterium]|jgi:phosphoglycerate kinase